MGYDMQWVDPMEPAGQAAYDQARQAFNHAVKARDTAFPREGDERCPDGHPLQQAVHEAYEAMDRTNKSYFRLNIFGMGRYRHWMCDLGMVHEYGQEPEFPDPQEYGLKEWPDEDDPSEGAQSFNKAREEALRYNPEVAGIAIWKLCSNDGWIVTPIECQGALHAWVEAGSSNPDTESPGYWLQWIEFLQGAVTHGGFRVY